MWDNFLPFNLIQMCSIVYYAPPPPLFTMYYIYSMHQQDGYWLLLVYVAAWYVSPLICQSSHKYIVLQLHSLWQIYLCFCGMVWLDVCRLTFVLRKWGTTHLNPLCWLEMWRWLLNRYVRMCIAEQWTDNSDCVPSTCSWTLSWDRSLFLCVTTPGNGGQPWRKKGTSI